jgi:F-type H+-transporting ATPase subunit b
MKDTIFILGATGAAEDSHDTHSATLSSENPAEVIAQNFKLEGGLFMSQLIVFGIVLFALNKFAYGPILAMLADRKSRIAESLDNAQKIKVELAEAAATRKQVIEEANAHANRIIEEAKSAADKVRSQETQKALALAEDIISKARKAAESDRNLMMAELKKEIGQLVVQTTSQVVGKVLNEEDKSRLIDETRKSIAA